MSIAVAVTVIANFVVMAVRNGQPPDWITYAPLLPLALLPFSGLYLFVRTTRGVTVVSTASFKHRAAADNLSAATPPYNE